MGEFNVNKSDGSLEQTAGMPSEYPATQVMLSDGVTSVADALDAVINGSVWTQIGTTGVYYRKLGSVVYVRFETPAILASSWTTIATLPVGFRPISNIVFCGYNSSTYVVNVKIFTSGEIKYVETGTTGAIPMYISFIAEN